MLHEAQIIMETLNERWKIKGMIFSFVRERKCSRYHVALQVSACDANSFLLGANI